MAAMASILEGLGRVRLAHKRECKRIAIRNSSGGGPRRRRNDAEETSELKDRSALVHSRRFLGGGRRLVDATALSGSSPR